jgi:hypothetical protein
VARHGLEIRTKISIQKTRLRPITRAEKLRGLEESKNLSITFISGHEVGELGITLSGSAAVLDFLKLLPKSSFPADGMGCTSQEQKTAES